MTVHRSFPKLSEQPRCHLLVTTDDSLGYGDVRCDLSAGHGGACVVQVYAYGQLVKQIAIHGKLP